MDQSSKTKELLEIYKGLAQCIYKEPANRNFVDCTKEVLANFQGQDNRNQSKATVENKTERYFQG